MPVIAPGTGASLWTPADLGSGLVFWFDAADTSTFDLSGNKVAAWRDKSRNRLSVGQATDASRPVVGTTVNNRNVVKWTYLTTDALSCAWPSALRVSQPWCWAVAFQVTATRPANYGPFVLGPYGAAIGYIRWTGSADKFAFTSVPNGGLWVDEDVYDLNPHVMIGRANSTASQLLSDGTLYTGDADNHTMGQWSDTLYIGHQFFTGWVGDFIAWHQAVDEPGTMRRVAAYLAAKWGIPSSTGGACSPPLVFL